MLKDLKYCIAKNFRGGKLSRISEKYNFCKENFRGLLAFAAPKDITPQISQGKLSRIATKPRISRKFSPSKVFRYSVYTSDFLWWGLVVAKSQLHEIVSSQTVPLHLRFSCMCCVSTVQGIGGKLQTHSLPKGFGGWGIGYTPAVLLPRSHTMIWYSMISLL